MVLAKEGVSKRQGDSPLEQKKIPQKIAWGKERFQRHNHYRFQDFFNFQPDTGLVTDWNETRNTFVSEDFIVGLAKGLEEEVGHASAVVMYNIGCQWGSKDAKGFRKTFREEFDQEIRQANLK